MTSAQKPDTRIPRSDTVLARFQTLSTTADGADQVDISDYNLL